MNIQSLLNPYPVSSGSQDPSPAAQPSTAQQATAVGSSLTPARNNPMALSVIMGQNIACRLRSQPPAAGTSKRRASDSTTTLALQASCETGPQQRAQQRAQEKWDDYRNRHASCWLPQFTALSNEDQARLVQAVLEDDAATMRNDEAPAGKRQRVSSSFDAGSETGVAARSTAQTFLLKNLQNRVDKLRGPSRTYAQDMLQQVMLQQVEEEAMSGRVTGKAAVNLNKLLTFLTKLEFKAGKRGMRSGVELLNSVIEPFSPSGQPATLNNENRKQCVEELKIRLDSKMGKNVFDAIKFLTTTKERPEGVALHSTEKRSKGVGLHSKHAARQIDRVIETIVRTLRRVETFSLQKLQARVDGLPEPSKSYAQGLLVRVKNNEELKYDIEDRIKGHAANDLNATLRFLTKLEDVAKSLGKQSGLNLLNEILQPYLESQSGASPGSDTRGECLKKLKEHFPHDIGRASVFKAIKFLTGVDLQSHAGASSVMSDDNPLPTGKNWSNLHDRFNEITSRVNRVEFKKLYEHRNKIPPAGDKKREGDAPSAALSSAMLLLEQLEKEKHRDADGKLVAMSVKRWAQELLRKSSLEISALPHPGRLSKEEREALNTALKKDPVFCKTGMRDRSPIIPLIYVATCESDDISESDDVSKPRLTVPA
jgi:hypothetical protein